MPLTLVPECNAAPGHAFHYLGPNAGEECQGCPFQRICFGLEPGRHYRVTAVRDVVHPCNLHADGRVRVVEVQPQPFETSLETKHLRGTAATWNPVPCGWPECANWKTCHPVGPPAGAKYAIQGVGQRLDCPAGYEVQRVRLERLPG